MLIERPPLIFRFLFPGTTFRKPPRERKTLYLTFDDGPIPEATPWVLDLLDRYGISATFFMVGDNARKYPDLVEEVRRRGHVIGNHTMHHLQGVKTSTEAYLADIEEAQKYLQTSLFRPPHGMLKWCQLRRLRRKYTVVMYDLVTRDYSKRLTADDVIENVKKYARDGSIIVFHDSLRSLPRIKKALPAAIEYLQREGYEFGKL